MSLTATFRKTLVEPLWAAYSGSPLLREWKRLEKTQFESPEAIRERQQIRLTELLSWLWQNNAFYRQRFETAGLSASDMLDPRSLARIPLLDKPVVREQLEEMISDGFSIDELHQYKTGGSTGRALILYISEETSELRNACARRSDLWSGWNVGEPTAAIWGNPVYPETRKEKLRAALLEPRMYLDTMEVNEESVREFAREWKQVKPTLIFGHAHSIYVLATMVRDHAIEGIDPEGIIATSMLLPRHERAVIESVFGVKVTDRYGCEEVGLIGCECERHDGMHLNADHLIVEFLRPDGSPAPAGETAQIIVTDLINRAMPMVRYRVGDMAARRDEPCPCGRGLPMMTNVIGRTADFLVKKDGTRVAGISLIENTLTRMPGIDQMQLVQDSLDTLTIRVVRGSAHTEQTDRELHDYFAGLFEGAAVTLEHVERIEPEANGKFRFSICRVG